MKILHVQKQIVVLLCFIFAVLGCTLLLLMPKVALAEAQFDPTSVEHLCAQLSQTDILEGAQPEGDEIPTLQSYIDGLKTGKYAGDDNLSPIILLG